MVVWQITRHFVYRTPGFQPRLLCHLLPNKGNGATHSATNDRQRTIIVINTMPKIYSPRVLLEITHLIHIDAIINNYLILINTRSRSRPLPRAGSLLFNRYDNDTVRIRSR